jgi:hypothetical protein
MLCISLYHFVSTVTGAIRKLRHQRGKVRRPAVRAPAPGETLRRKSWMNLVTYLYDHHKLWLWFSDFFSRDLFCSKRAAVAKRAAGWYPQDFLRSCVRHRWGWKVPPRLWSRVTCMAQFLWWFPKSWATPKHPSHGSWLGMAFPWRLGDPPWLYRTHPQKNRVFAGTFLLTIHDYTIL